MNERFQEIIKCVQKAKTIAIYLHTNPDGDAIGSALSLYFATIKKGKRVDVFCDTEIPAKFNVLKGIEVISFPTKGIHDLSIAVDCSDMDRLGSCIKSFLSSKYQIAIDHHKTHQKFADLTLVDADAAACAQIIYKLIKQMKLVDANIAKLIFCGIVTDSGCFSFSNVSPETHNIAMELLEYDFNASQIIYDVHKKNTIDKFNLKNRVLNKSQFFEDNQIGVIYFSQEDFDATNTSTSNTEGVIVSVIDIDTVKVAYAISQVGDKNYKVSIRTKEGVDASDCARVFGGGGHERAAGCRINGYIEDVIEKLVKVARDRM